MKPVYILALFVSAFILTACGGGGSPFVPEPLTTTIAGARDAANRIPASEAVRSIFDGTDVVLTVTRQDRSTLTLDSSQHVVTEHDPNQTDRAGRPRIHSRITDQGTGSITTATVDISWGNDDFSDYTAGGWWIHVEGERKANPIPSGRVEDAFETITSVEVGAFMDGPEFMDTPVLPELGTATYNGETRGLFVSLITEPDAMVISGLPFAIRQYGEYMGDVTFTADFSDMTIAGVVDNISLEGDIVMAVDNTFVTKFAAPSTYRADLLELPIRPDGTFSGSGVKITNPHRDIVSSEGSWSGKFSTLADSNDVSRLVGGTAGGSFRTANDSEVVFIGPFYGVTPQFRKDVAGQ